MSQDEAPRLGLLSHELQSGNVNRLGVVALEHHKITLLLQGEGSGRVANYPILPKRPVIWFTGAGESETLNLNGEIEAWWFSFDWPQMQWLATNDQDVRLTCYGKSFRTRRIKQMDHGDASRMVEHFKNMLRATSRWEMMGELEVRSFIHLLIAFFVDLPDDLTRSAGHRALQAFREALDQRAFEDICIEQLADEVNLSRGHLRSLFYERFGVHPHAYRTALRMARARQLLSHPNMTVTQAAHQVGYGDPFYFSRAFRKRYGMSPSEVLRKSHGE